ncbi:hypothetical protein ACFVR1_18730 [Psychrobacillus sp. NPDC058041]|uniref:hypothetical protein n=1 Tax=Psychrobacillus sp. NPDC058041 TaxID=3346310 RepID=UPI0036DB0A36
MKNNTKWALIASISTLTVIPLIFFIISLLTGQWKYLIFSLPPSFTAGSTGLFLVRQIKKEKEY